MGGGGGVGGGGSDDGGIAFVAVDEKTDKEEDGSRPDRRAAALVNKNETPFLSQLKAFHKRRSDKPLKIPVFCHVELDLQHVYHEARGIRSLTQPHHGYNPPSAFTRHVHVLFQRRLLPHQRLTVYRARARGQHHG